MQMNYPKAKSLCTDVEFQILNSVKPQALAAMNPSELRALASKARKYSDKWLALSRKQGTATDGAGARSFAKHELFKEALTRAEAKLANAAPAKPTPAKAAAKATVTNKTGPMKKATVTPKAAFAKKTAAANMGASKNAVKAAAKKVAKKAAKKAVSSRARSDMSLATQAKQKSIGTGLRMAASGKNSRVRGHVSAQGRRNQAARSARKR